MITRGFQSALRGPRTGLAVVCAALVLAGSAAPAIAQAPASSPPAPDPRAAQPERPSVATHAFTVAPGIFELEAGGTRQAEGALSDYIAVPLLLKVGLGSRVQLDIGPGWQRNDDSGRVTAGMTDLVLGIKWRLVDDAPVLGAFALQATAALPTGSADQGTGTDEMAVNLLAISSRAIGPVALDLNLGYTRRGGDGSTAPKNEAVWAVSTGFPIAGKLGWVAEVFGIPGTSGPAGGPPVVGFLTGPTLAVTRSLILDVGATFDITGYGATSWFAGLTWNMGRAWGGK
jgi:hypothetical protein